MIRITALNDRNKYVHGGQKSCVSTTKEALESEAITLYNKGLNFRNQGQTKQAIQTLTDVLNLPFLQEATFSSSEDGISHSAELLKYSAYKNLAEMSEIEENKVVAMEYYIEAVAVDSTDVTVWFKMGRLALSIENFSLARHAFEMGLQCNSNHWPCLDNIISLMYALNNYEACLHYIARALGLDPGYTKALVFMRRIFSQHPGLRSWSMDIFLKCDHSIYVADVDEEESEEYLKEAVAIRLRKQELCKAPELPSVTFTQPLTSFTWRSLGERLFELYEHVAHVVKEQTDISQPGLSLACQVDLTVNVLPLKSTDVVLVPPSPPPPPPPPVTILSQTPCGEIAPPNATGIDSIPTTPTRDPLVSLSEMGSGMEMEDVTFSGGRKRGRKRKSMFVDEPEYKRRSSRVKNPVKSSVEGPISYQEVLYKLLPKALLTNSDDCQLTRDLLQLEMTSGGDDKSKDAFEKTCMLRKMANEEDDVQKFINDHKANNGLIELITKFLIHLAGSSDLIWPDGLTEMFLKLYQKLRKHLVYPNYFSNDSSDEWIQKMAKMSLMHKELKLDRWLANNINIIQLTPRKSPVGGMMGPNFPGKYFETDIDYLIGLSCLPDRLGDFWLEFSIRVSWLQARYSLLQNNMEMATGCFEKTAEYMQMMLNESTSTSICLANCTAGRIISLRELEQQLDSLRRCQSMEELRCLADSGQHGKVLDFLLPASAAAKDLDVERMQLLQESIVASKEYRRGLLWAEEYFHETLRRYKTTTSASQKDICKEILIQLLVALNQFLDGDPSVMAAVSGQWMFRLSHNLLDIINISLDVPEGAVGMALETVTPWIILYKLIKHCEDSETSANNDEEVLSSSLSLIIYAHEYLGRRSWCTTCEGELLLFMVQALMEELDKYGIDDPHPFEEDLDNAVQQCFLCLFSHRSKKAKYLDDHNVPQIQLTLERCQRMFDFFKPKTLPEYDSYKMNAISAELEALLKRIFPLIPLMNSSGIEADINAYIDGATNTPPSVHADREVKYPLVKELYYLLADYYFKNKEQLKAIKFYMFDICINPARFDSWAGMALARSSRLENKLTSDMLDDKDQHDLKQEASLQKQAVSTLRCFKRAMELDDSNVKLWIEYGSCAYQLHSHSSRLLKQTKFSPLAKETVDQATSNKSEMLMIALNCYNQAEACALESGNKEEKWLLHYMLGKIAEKLDQDPSIYLEHYKKASYCLHEDKAKYPKKISYFSPPHLSVEALEMYYRTHVCIVKYLMKREKEFEKIPFDVFELYIKDASNSPLSNCAEKEKKHDRKSELVESKETPGVRGGLGGGGTQSTCNDHNYSKPKASTQSTAPTTDSIKDTIPSTSALPPPSTSIPAPLPYPSSSEDVSGGRVGGSSPQNPPLGETGLGVAQSSASKMEDQPLDLTLHPAVAGSAGMDTQAAALLSSKNQPEIVDLDMCPQRETDMEVTVNQPESDNPSCQQELGTQQDATVSLANVSPRTEQRTDSDALDDLILTLAAVQKSLQTEDKVETVLGTEKQDNDSEMATAATEAMVVKTEMSILEESPVNVDKTLGNGGGSPGKGVAMDVEMPHGVKPEKQDEPMDVEGGSGGTVEKQPSGKTEDQGKDEGGSGPHPKDDVKPVEQTAVASHQQLRKRFHSLMNDCMKALYLCQTRFPEHFKSLYRLAYICFYSVHYKDVVRCKELLLGGGSAHIGLFIERKQNNFFNGLWRNPVQDLDRWGSFSAHLNKALLLLFEVLTVTRDSRLLFSLHQHLCRAPVDIGKKYLRDTDRVQLARMAFTLCCKALEALVRGYELAKGVSSSNRPDKRFLLHVCLIRQESHKLNLNVKELDDLLVTTYGLCDASEVSGPLTEDAIQHHFALMQTPKVLQCGPFERDSRHLLGDLHMPMTSAMAMNLASNRTGMRLAAPPTTTRPLQVEKPFQVPYRPIQRPLFQPDKIQKPVSSTVSEDDVEIIDLSADDCVQVVNVSSSAEEEMLTSEDVRLNSLCDESGSSKGRSEVKKDENPQACCDSVKDVSQPEALPKDIPIEVVAPTLPRKEIVKEAAQDLFSRSITAPINVPVSGKDPSKATVRQKEFSRLPASSKEHSKAAESPKELSRVVALSQELARSPRDLVARAAESPKELSRVVASSQELPRSPRDLARAVEKAIISKPAPSQKSVMTSALLKDAPNPAFLRAAASMKGVRPTKETLQFYTTGKSSMTDKPTPRPVPRENIRTEPYRKASMPSSLLSNKDLLSTLPQETRNLLISPQKIVQQQQSPAAHQAPNIASKWYLAPQPGHSNQQVATRVRPVSPSPSEQSSSSLSDNNDDEKDEVIELSSSIESD